MRRVTPPVLLMVLLALAGFVPAPAAASGCSYSSEQSVDLGGTRVYHLSERCGWQFGSERYAHRAERFDILRVEPSHVNGAVSIVTLLVISKERDYANGTSTQRHDVMLGWENGGNATASYGHTSYNTGFTACALAGQTRTGTWGATYTTPYLPACMPRGIMLP